MEHLPYRPIVGGLAGKVVLLSSQYRPLHDYEFRVLRLEGYDESGILKCTLQHASFVADSHEPYCAISYTWKEERVWYGKYDYTISQPIWIGDNLVMVSNKVSNILSMMFQKARRTLWIDSICINQVDDVDKSKQVAHMGCIYSSAAEIMSVLGSPDTNTDAALEPDNWFSADLYESKQRDRSLKVGLLQVTVDGYWMRSWVLQEIAMAKTASVCCGSRTVDFLVAKEFWRRHLAAPIRMPLPRDRRTTVNLYRETKLFAGSLLRDGTQGLPFDIGSAKDFLNLDFLTLLETSRRFKKSQDPRDFIYSRLALATDAATLVASPDYSLSVEEVYSRFAASWITTSHKLEIIRHARPSDTMKLPTWVPNWTSRSLDWESDVAFERQTGTESMSFLSWDGPSTPSVEPGRWELVVRGRALIQIPEPTNDIPEQTGGLSKRLKRGIEQGLRRSYEYGVQAAISRGTALELGMVYPSEDDIAPGDFVCALQGYSGFVCLRAVDDHFIMVGRMKHSPVMEAIEDLVWVYSSNPAPLDFIRKDTDAQWKRWRFRCPEEISAIEQKYFRIR